MALKYTPNNVISVLRAQNWARVKGELEGLLSTFIDSNPTEKLQIEEAIINFVDTIERKMR